MRKKNNKAIFITGTDTDVGKTIATLCIATLLQKKGLDVGVMKPIQCGGNDTHFLRKSLGLNDPMTLMNPYFSKEPLSPHLAFQRGGTQIRIKKIMDAYSRLKQCHDILIVEGAGGLMVPINKDYLMADLIGEMNCETIIVSRLSLGTINHSLLTLTQARERGIHIKGLLFNESRKVRKGIPEKTNPKAIQTYGDVNVLGTIPYLKKFSSDEIVKTCSHQLRINDILSNPRREEPKVPSSRTDHLQALDKSYIWHPFTQMQNWLEEKPLVIDEAKGSYLIDTDGQKYLDGVSSLWVNVHGHQNRVIDRAIKKQIDKLSHSTLLGLSNTPAIELAEKLVEITPKGLEKIFYSDSGSTSVEIAIKIAYQYWQNKGLKEKKQLVHLKDSYHGDTLGSVSVGGIDLFHKVYRDLIVKTMAIESPSNICSFTNDNIKKYLNDLEVFLQKRNRTIAAFIVEPIVQGAAGMLIWPKGILKGFEKLCKKYDVIFIVDEVATGFGRTGKMFACEHENVKPDILCLAKGLTGGYLPLAATLTTKKIYKGFLFDYKEMKTFFHGHTYTGNPLCCAAALASIKLFRQNKTLEHLDRSIKYLKSQLKKFYNLNHVGNIRQKGYMVGIELVKNKNGNRPYRWEEEIGVKVCKKVRERGIILRPLGNVIVLMPPLSMSKNELKKLLDITYWAIQEVTDY